MHVNSSLASPIPSSAAARHVRDAYAVILASGPEDGGKRATLALAAACTAQAMALDTIVFLIGDGAHWAYAGHAEQVNAPGFPALADLMESFLDGGGQLLLCSACHATCAHGGVHRPEVRIRGLATLLSHTVDGGAVTF